MEGVCLKRRTPVEMFGGGGGGISASTGSGKGAGFKSSAMTAHV